MAVIATPEELRAMTQIVDDVYKEGTIPITLDAVEAIHNAGHDAFSKEVPAFLVMPKATVFGKAAGVKYDSGKPRFDLIPAVPLETLAKIYTMGAEKYADRNWEKGIRYSRIYAAVMRHLNKYWSSENLDPESGLPHLAHAAWGLLALLEFDATHPELDDRPNVSKA